MHNWLDHAAGASTLAMDALPTGMRKETVVMTATGKPCPQPGRWAEGTDFVPVTYASTLTEAEWLRSFLEGEEIPAVVEAEPSAGGRTSMGRGIPVLVPDDRLEEAADVIASHLQAEAAAKEEEDQDEDDFDEDEDEDFDDEEDEEDFEEEDLEEDEELLEDEDAEEDEEEDEEDEEG
jgi:hypothetical protein